jgi:hypothetical protein
MNYSNYPLTDQEIIQHICDGYLAKHEDGIDNYYLSRDVGTEINVQTMVEIHNFVEQIAKSEQVAVKLETTIHGKRCLGVTPIGDTLYRIFRSQYRFGSTPRQQLSEALKLWDEITLRVLGQHAWFCGDPLRRMNDLGINEGELLNSMATRLREGTQRAGYKAARDKRRKEVQRVCTAMNKLITGLYEHHPAMFGMKVELMYRSDCAEKIRLTESEEHILGLIEALKEHPWFGKSIGHFWTRKFLSEAGYRISLFLLFDPNTTPFQMIDGAHVLQQWSENTKGAGLGYVAPGSFWNADALFRYIECSKMAAQYLRLIPDAKYPHFGKSDLSNSKSLSEYEQDTTCGLARSQPENLNAHLTNSFK